MSEFLKGAADRMQFRKLLHVGCQCFALPAVREEAAYLYACKNYQETASQLTKSLSKEEFAKREENLLHYAILKSCEAAVAEELYSAAEHRHRIDVYYAPGDADLPYYFMNLPFHLEKELNCLQRTAREFAKKYIAGGTNRTNDDIRPETEMLAMAFLGRYLADFGRFAETKIKTYDNALLMNRNELEQKAGEGLCTWLEGQGYTVLEKNLSRDTAQHIVAKKEERLCYVLMAAAVTPEQPLLLQKDAEALKLLAGAEGAIPMVAAVQCASQEQQHFSDGALYYNEEPILRVLSFREI